MNSGDNRSTYISAHRQLSFDNHGKHTLVCSMEGYKAILPKGWRYGSTTCLEQHTIIKQIHKYICGTDDIPEVAEGAQDRFPASLLCGNAFNELNQEIALN